jgi:hypothetical protein
MSRPPQLAGPALAALLLCLVLAPDAQARAPRAALLSCDRGARAAVFEGRMDAAADGAARMQMRFRLQATEPGDSGWHAIAVPGFGGWVTADAGRPRYVFRRRVEQLLAPASYRVQVRFRWIDGAGDTVATASATSRPCRQPDPRPDLAVTAIDVRPASAGSRRYVVTVRNSGRSAAPASTVALELGAGAPLTVTLGALGPGAGATVAFTAPPCEPGTAVVAVADASDTVDERDEDDDVLTITCT